MKLYYLVAEGSDCYGPCTLEDAKKEAEGMSADEYEICEIVLKSSDSPRTIQWVKP